MKNKEMWLDESTRWNVIEAEENIDSIYQLVRYRRVSEDIFLKVIGTFFSDEKYRSVVHDATVEMQEILDNKDNSYKRHINHITSGKMIYGLFLNNGDAMTQYGEYVDTREAAEEIAKDIKSMVKYEIDETPDGKYAVLVEDDVVTEDMRKNHVGGEFVDVFDSREEAEDEGKSLGDYYILEQPSEEWYVVVNNETEKRVFDIMFPSLKRAIAFMYRELKPKAWVDYISFEGGEE